MERKTQMDTFGAVALTLFALNLAFNQVVVKVTAGGFEPIFGAGVRSLGGMLVLLLWILSEAVFVFRSCWAFGICSCWVVSGSVLVLEWMLKHLKFRIKKETKRFIY